MASNLKSGDPVWAKMKGFPTWPAILTNPPSTPGSIIKKNSSYVKFFGTGDFAWICNKDLTPHSENMLSEAKRKKRLSTSFKKAIAEISVYAKAYTKEIKILDLEHNAYIKYNCELSRKTIGFVGLRRAVGRNILKCLIQSGHEVLIWSKSDSRCEPFVRMGATQVPSLSELFFSTDILISCVSNREASKSLFFREFGLLWHFREAREIGLTGKAYVEMTGIDNETCKLFSQFVSREKGAFLEATVFGTAEDAAEGDISVFAAGDKELFKACRTCFNAISNEIIYVSSEAGEAVTYKLYLSVALLNELKPW